jgi:hypothetical protein
MAKENIISVRFDDRLAASLDARGEYRAEVVRRCLARYYDLLERTRETLRSECGGFPPFTPGECGAILDSCNGTIFEPWSIPLVAANVEDSGRGLYEKWGIDGTVLMDKINALDLAENHTLVDAIERWWHGQCNDPSTLLD